VGGGRMKWRNVSIGDAAFSQITLEFLVVLVVSMNSFSTACQTV